MALPIELCRRVYDYLADARTAAALATASHSWRASEGAVLWRRRDLLRRLGASDAGWRRSFGDAPARAGQDLGALLAARAGWHDDDKRRGVAVGATYPTASGTMMVSCVAARGFACPLPPRLPDVATGDFEGAVQTWRGIGRTGGHAPWETLRGHEHAVFGVQWTTPQEADVAGLVSASLDGTVCHWRDGFLVARLGSLRDSPRLLALAVEPPGAGGRSNFAFAGGMDGSVSCWPLAIVGARPAVAVTIDTRCVYCLERTTLCGHQVLAVGTHDGSVVLLDVVPLREGRAGVRFGTVFLGKVARYYLNKSPAMGMAFDGDDCVVGHKKGSLTVLRFARHGAPWAEAAPGYRALNCWADGGPADAEDDVGDAAKWVTCRAVAFLETPHSAVRDVAIVDGVVFTAGNSGQFYQHELRYLLKQTCDVRSPSIALGAPGNDFEAQWTPFVSRCSGASPGRQLAAIATSFGCTVTVGMGEAVEDPAAAAVRFAYFWSPCEADDGSSESSS